MMDPRWLDKTLAFLKSEKAVMVVIAVFVLGGVVAVSRLSRDDKPVDERLAMNWDSARQKGWQEQRTARPMKTPAPKSGLGLFAKTDDKKSDALGKGGVKPSRPKKESEPPEVEPYRRGGPGAGALTPRSGFYDQNPRTSGGGMAGVDAPEADGKGGGGEAPNALQPAQTQPRSLLGRVGSRIRSAANRLLGKKESGFSSLQHGGKAPPKIAGGVNSAYTPGASPIAGATEGQEGAGTGVPQEPAGTQTSGGGTSGGSGGGGTTASPPVAPPDGEPSGEHDEGEDEMAPIGEHESEHEEGDLNDAQQCLDNAKNETTRCSAYKCGADDSLRIDIDSKSSHEKVKDSVLDILNAVKPEIENAVAQQKTIQDTADGEKYSCTGCDGLNTCVNNGKTEVAEIVALLVGELTKLDAAIACLGEEQPGAGCHDNALEAIDKEREAVEKMAQHISSHDQLESCDNGIPDTVTRKRYNGTTRRYEDYTVSYEEGSKAKKDFKSFTDWEKGEQEKQMEAIQDPWCDRHSCQPPIEDIAELRKDIHDHSEAFDEFKEYIPGLARRLGEADRLLSEAEALLSAPAGAESRNLINGDKDYAEASILLEDVKVSWEAKSVEACSQ